MIDVSHFEMNERDVRIVDTALDLFAHYGVKKTTMSEVAKAAGVARQTLYNSFDGKEELIFGANVHRARVSAKKIHDECAGLKDLGGRLDIAFRHLARSPFETIIRMPHREEIRQVAQQFSRERKKTIFDLYNMSIAIALEPFKEKLRLGQVDFYDLCDYIRVSFEHIMFDSSELEQLLKYYAPLRMMVLNSVDE